MNCASGLHAALRMCRNLNIEMALLASYFNRRWWGDSCSTKSDNSHSCYCWYQHSVLPSSSFLPYSTTHMSSYQIFYLTTIYYLKYVSHAHRFTWHRLYLYNLDFNQDHLQHEWNLNPRIVIKGINFIELNPASLVWHPMPWIAIYSNLTLQILVHYLCSPTYLLPQSELTNTYLSTIYTLKWASGIINLFIY